MAIQADCPSQGGFWFQDPATPILEAILSLHHDILFFVIIICVLVCGFIFQAIYFYFEPQMSNEISLFNQVYNKPSGRKHQASVEIIWTLIPSWILMSIATPSFALLYSMDEIIYPTMTLKIVGHQWYWSYEYSDDIFAPCFNFRKMRLIRHDIVQDGMDYFNYDNLLGVLLEDPRYQGMQSHESRVHYWTGFGRAWVRLANLIEYGNFPSAILGKERVARDLSISPFESYLNYVKPKLKRYNTFRLLDTDFGITLPTKEHIRLLVTSSDVLHSWAVPSFGIKLDACPGRLNQTSLFIKRRGVFYGQCSEICGVNHAFMPIKIIAKPLDIFMYQLDFVSRANEISDVGENHASYNLYDDLERLSRYVKSLELTPAQWRQLRLEMVQDAFVLQLMRAREEKKPILSLEQRCLFNIPLKYFFMR